MGGRASTAQINQKAIQLLDKTFPKKKDTFEDYRIVVRPDSKQGPVFPPGFAMEKYPWSSTFLLFKKLRANADEQNILGIQGTVPYYLGQVISLHPENLTNEQIMQHMNAFEAFVAYLKEIERIQEKNRLVVPRLSKWVVVDNNELIAVSEIKAKNNLILLYEIEGSDVIPLNELKEDEDTPTAKFEVFFSILVRLVATYMFHEKLQIFPKLDPDRMIWIGSKGKDACRI